MTISRELFLSILAMDSYNRNYGSGIDGLPGKGAAISGSTIQSDEVVSLISGMPGFGFDRMPTAAKCATSR